MRKITAILLTVVLSLISLCALAEQAGEINWDMVEPQIIEAGWEGEFVTFNEIAVKVWIPSVLLADELTDEAREEGYIGYFTTEDQTAAVGVTYTDMDGMELNEYAEQLPGYGATEIEMGIVNGLPVVTYKLPENDTACLTITTEAGYALEFSFAPMSDEGFSALTGFIIASIQEA